MSDQSSARDGWQDDRTTFQRVYDLVVGTTAAEPAASYAERADCSETGARETLNQLAEMGIAERTEGRPATYRRNPSYFRWKRAEDLARDHSVAALRERVDDLLETDQAYQDQYDAPDPDSVTVDDGIEDHARLHERWDDLGEWRTIRRDIGVLKQAIQRAESRRDDKARA